MVGGRKRLPAADLPVTLYDRKRAFMRSLFRPGAFSRVRGQIALAIALALVAIGCSSDPSEQATPTAQEQVVDDSQPVEADAEQPIEEEAPVETSTSTTTTELTQNEPTASELSCESVVSPAEIDEAFGTSVQEINGGGGFCNIIYSADFIGGLVIVPADEAQVALDVLVESETGQGRAPQVLSEDGARGLSLIHISEPTRPY